MFDDFRARHPIVFWVIVIGVALIAVWALGSRLLSAPANTSTALTVAGPSDAQVQGSYALQTAQIQAASDAQTRADQFALAEEQLGVQYKLAQLDNNRGMAGDILNYNAVIAGMTAQTQQTGIVADLQKFVTSSNNQVATSQINAWRDTQLAVTNAQIQMNAANNKTTRHQSNNGLLGGLLGGVIGLFSDERLKEDFLFSHVDRKTGLTWWSFTYTKHAQKLLRLPSHRLVGVIAQDLVDTKHAKAVRRDASGFLKVDYSQIMGETEKHLVGMGLEIG